MSCLQRLRQGQGRSQQLLSLLQWHEQALAAGGGQPARGFADQAAAVAFAKGRKGFENSLSELRKQWAKERQEKEAAKAAAEQAARCVPLPAAGRSRSRGMQLLLSFVGCLAACAWEYLISYSFVGPRSCLPGHGNFAAVALAAASLPLLLAARFRLGAEAEQFQARVQLQVARMPGIPPCTCTDAKCGLCPHAVA